jgi:endonuclease YncB( thermonuclease family)
MAMLRCGQPRTRNVAAQRSFRHAIDGAHAAFRYCGMRLVLLLFLLIVIPATASAACGIADLGSVEVAAVRDDATLLLKDGRELRLAGIEPGPTAQPLLLILAQGRPIRLSAATQPATDRYGRLVAFARTDDGSLQEALLTQGAARVAVRAGGRNCADVLLKLENDARQARRGLWGDPNFAPLRAEPGTWTQERLGTFVVIEGVVVSVRQSGGTVYVNFGRRFTRDFTLTMPRRLQAAFREAGRDPQMLQGRRVRVRGWLERRTGPIIEASAPEQIELLE